MLIQKPRIPLRQILLYGFLPGFLKIFVYRLRGYKIGKSVSIGLGSVICAKDVSIGDHTKIGLCTIIRGEQINIGSHVRIGSITFLDTPYLEIGDESKINELVFIGGLQSYDSKFVAGKNCQIMQMAFINPSRSIVIGDEVAIGGHCLLFGHNSWLSRIEGYDVSFEEIEIGNNVALSWGVFLLPGTKIGDGSLIAAHSVVNRTVPPKCLAAGYPARVISKSPDFPKQVSEEQKIVILSDIANEMVAYFNGSGLICKKEGGDFRIEQVKKSFLIKRRNTWWFSIEYEFIAEDFALNRSEDLNVFISLKSIPLKLRRQLNAADIAWFDIEKKERPLFCNDAGNEIALFLRRHGIRFIRVKE